MPTNESTANENQSNDSPPPNRPSIVLQNKIELALAACRTITVICTILYVVPLFGRSVQLSAYQKALLANGATSALRLHQRLPNFRLTYEFLEQLLKEDSAHYLFYSILFIFNRQITMVLLPIFLFALLHLLSFILRFMSETNRRGDSYQRIHRFVEMYKIYMFQMIALGEILLLPILLFASLGDFSKLFILLPYYRFLVCRYVSRRNPYNRAMFSELKNTAVNVTNLPQCPNMVRNFTYKFIAFVTSLAPPIENAHTN